jgi:hypothetical protein
LLQYAEERNASKYLATVCFSRGSGWARTSGWAAKQYCQGSVEHRNNPGNGYIVVESSQRHPAGTQIKNPIVIGANSNDLAYPQEKTMAELFAPFAGNSDQAQKIYDPDHSANEP